MLELVRVDMFIRALQVNVNIKKKHDFKSVCFDNLFCRSTFHIVKLLSFISLFIHPLPFCSFLSFFHSLFIFHPLSFHVGLNICYALTLLLSTLMALYLSIYVSLYLFYIGIYPFLY